MRRLTVAVPQPFAEELAAKLAVPHSLRTLHGQGDAEIAALLAESDVLVSGEYRAAWRGDRPTGRPQLVHSPGAGIDGIELSSLPAGCTVCNVYGHERGVAEQVFLLILALQRHLFKLDAGMRAGNWSPQWPYLSELRQRHLLILGLGHIGTELARWGKFLDMRVSAVTRTPSEERAKRHGLEALGGLGDLGRFLPQADFVVVAVPASRDCVDLIGAAELERMKPGAYLVNVGRARVVNEEALFRALQARRIGGAGLDVWYQYPETEREIGWPSRFPFQELDNVIMTPHKPTAETMAYRWGKIAENIARFHRGEPLENVVHVAR